jgi:type IV pilus assembly protein PilC
VAVFTYKAIDGQGKPCAGLCEALSQAALAEELKAKGIFLMEARLKASKAPAPVAVRKEAPLKKVPLDALAIFTSDFAIMLRSGIPVAEALHILMRQQRHPSFKRVLTELSRGVQEGQALSDSFGRFPKVFDPIFIALLRSGEASGNVPLMLERVSHHIEFQREMRTKIRSALLYPAIIILTGIGVVSFLVLFILPTFAEIFTQLNTELPLPTRALLAISGNLRVWWWLYGIALAGAGWGFKCWANTPAHAEILERAQLRIPVIGDLIRNIVTTRILRTLGALISGGVPILESLELAGQTAFHSVFRQMIDRVRQSASEGKGLSTALAGNPFFPETATHMIANAELTGTLPEVMTQISQYYEKETDITIRNVFTVLEPIFIVFIGLAVGTVAVAILWPMFKLDAAGP